MRTTPFSMFSLCLLVACGTGSSGHHAGGTGGEPEESGGGGAPGGSGGKVAGGGTGGGVAGSGGSAPGSGGNSAGSGGTGGAGTGGADASGGGGGADASVSTPDASSPTGPINYGGPGEHPSVPLQYTDTPTPPLVMPECPDDPTQGFTEYKGTFVVQRPYDLAGADRFSYADGVYTVFVKSSDKAHQPGNTTAPRTEARYPNFSSGEHIWSGDVLLDEPLSRTCIFQIHNVEASIAVYLRVVGGRLFNLSTGKTILPSAYGKWFNLKVAFNTQTHQVKTYINNCLKETSQSPSGPTPNWYFKHGTYTCDSGTCRDHYKNIHLYQK
jgi:hypothetical protein